MQTFRAFLRDSAGTITWAAWIEAAHADDAQVQAAALCAGQNPTLELWSATERKLDGSARLEAV